MLGICAGVLAPLESCAGGGPPPVMAIRRIANLGQKPAAANSSLDQGEVLDLENSLDKTPWWARNSKLLWNQTRARAISGNVN